MITINFNIAADEALGEALKTASSSPASVPYPGNKEGALEALDQIITPAEFQNYETPPAPATGHMGMLPQPSDSGLDNPAREAPLPTPTDADGGGASAPESGTPRPSVPTLPQPATDANDSSQEITQGGIPTPNEDTSLAKEVNDTIGKAPKKSSRSKATRSRSTAKKK